MYWEMINSQKKPLFFFFFFFDDKGSLPKLSYF